MVKYSWVSAGGERSNQSYIQINESSKNWTEAQRYCREKHTDLVSVRNQTENEEVKRLIPDNKWVWIGLYRDSWKWSDQENSSFRNWSSGEPNNAGGQESCAQVQLKGTERGGWRDAACNERLPFFCYSSEFIYSHNLILVRENKSWNEALSYCRQHHVDLVSVSTEQLQHWVERRAQAASTPYVWLGLRYTCVLHFWFWVSGEGVCYQNWAPGNGTGECGNTGAVESGGGRQWVSLPETEELNFICSNATEC
ncbi:C-type mannose receptor 2-like [Megalops cyprinoides]|uniref:C-type mannose receptor 2-like n=1 Tax=Megalops cyprinoides TaxID=118141 RepID=UPI001863F009|nr:C-type mannose receptor 2-like [Megalops cyprinoides]